MATSINSAKGTPPGREVILAPFSTPRCQNGVSPNSVKCCVIAKRVCCVQLVKRWTYPNMVSVPLCTNWKCRTSTGTKVPPTHPPLPLSVGNEELRLSFLLAHCIANGEKRLTVPLSFCAFPCRSLLAVCLSTIPAAKALLVFAGLESLLSIDHWHLPTALGPAWTDELPTFVRTYVLRHVLLFLCLYFARKCVLCKSAWRHVKQE